MDRKLLVVVASGLLAMLVVVLAQHGHADASRPRVSARASSTPSAAEFGAALVAATNTYAREHGEARRISGANCVQATAGSYMCSYLSIASGTPPQCHVMQGRWTPRAASMITVTLAGRTAKCGSLREALRSLG
jgi:hypothetical protein